MVFFTCNGCGESLKKAQVETREHLPGGDDYKNHVKCISEDQKYGGKGYEAKANKGDIKQQQWIQKVHDAMNKPGVSAKLKDVLQQVSAYDNVPRKRSKFQNWMRNSLNIANTGLHDEVWDILSAAASSGPQETKEAKQTVAEVKAETNGDEKQNGNEDAEKKKKLNKRERKEARQQKSGKAVKTAEKTDAQEPGEGKKKKKDRKRKHSSEEEEEEEEQNGAGNETASKKTKTTDQEEDDSTEETEDQQVPKGKFNWKGNIKAVLKDSDDQELSLKKLRKKVLSAYYTFTGDGNFRKEEEVLAIFNKKVTKNPKFRVLKERVRLIK
ncbi:hypothetical protein F7725_016759 [Dissostichus mawsoni]|uniref:Cell growth-regulating nucleolar protein n=1 Tax=Dissostichus mawsoni TaxID=36200 RepID=A0A7J5Z371_DISMA|nr:hypothetical protein F7725_016759 [Dissostichus mawsoni]